MAISELPKKQIAAAGRPDGVAAGASAVQLASRLRSRTARVGVLGLGYAGLPMAVELARAGFHVTGLDVDASRVRQVSSGQSPVSDVSDAEVGRLVGQSQLRATGDFRALADVDCVLICVPTPLTPERRQDSRYIAEAAKSIAMNLHPGMLVILQSTCAPGTTRRVLLGELLSRIELSVGEDYFVAFAPERIDPGNARFTIRNTPKLVAGVTPRCQELASLLFEPVADQIVAVSTPEVAEMTKLLENTFRFINISFINEMAVLCDRLGISIWEVIGAAASKPFAFMPHYPGPGVGGHCIPIVPFFLEEVAQDQGMVAELIQVAGRINDDMPRFVVQKLERLLAERGKSLSESKVLLLGMAYKADVEDCRESPALSVLQLLTESAGDVAYYDPYVPLVHRGDVPAVSLSFLEATEREFDAAVLLTAHSGVDYAQVARHVGLTLDTRNYLPEIPGAEIVKL